MMKKWLLTKKAATMLLSLLGLALFVFLPVYPCSYCSTRLKTCNPPDTSGKNLIHKLHCPIEDYCHRECVHMPGFQH